MTPETLTERHAKRHRSTVQMLRWLEPNRRLPITVLPVANQIAVLTDRMVESCPDGPELTAGLRKLLEAKDCFVRAALTGVDEDSIEGRRI
jgi:hypothetical protein